ncbi:extracellular solute-binding protein [Ahrensia marina]|jgi:putative spermidine/putrescine transport system substrate-binding protein|uniref:Spermidine/putrescine ABC transporter substrate-binding protein n=2 Tax=Hyphomicrobiales TaxID=356 RepID=A0A0N0E7D0_9HYPH|nr:extracellular solute-binding protein [Ahrensia marina]KPB01035.1 spermidine/putrescine ABC transporter substrate-binding protein [Ahrensia marina]
MKHKSLLLAAAASTALFSSTAIAQENLAEAPCEGCAEEMTLVSWGGAYQQSQLKAYVEPYVAATGVKVSFDESSAEATAKLRAMNEAGNVTWDVVDVVASDAIRLCDEGLAAELDPATDLAEAPDGTSAEDDFGNLRVNECFIPQIVYSTTIGYRTDMVGDNPPTEICDIFDTEAYPGKRALQKRPIDNLEWATYCNGTPKEEIYEVLSTDEGVQAAFDKLSTIKDDVVWWTAGAETPQLLADGEVVMGSTFNGRLFSAIVEQDQPIGMMWDMQSFDLDGWIIPAGLEESRMKRAKHFLKFATDTQRLADQAKYISYGPARKSSAPLVGKHEELGIDMAPHMPTDPANAGNVHNYDYTWWADNRDDLDAKFQAWLAQ